MSLIPGKPWYKSVTAWGCVAMAAAGGICASPDAMALLPANFCHYVEIAGMILGFLGVRRAQPAPAPADEAKQS